MLMSCYLAISMMHPKRAYDQPIAKHTVGSFLNPCHFLNVMLALFFVLLFFEVITSLKNNILNTSRTYNTDKM